MCSSVGASLPNSHGEISANPWTTFFLWLTHSRLVKTSGQGTVSAPTRCFCRLQAVPCWELLPGTASPTDPGLLENRASMMQPRVHCVPLLQHSPDSQQPEASLRLESDFATVVNSLQVPSPELLSRVVGSEWCKRKKNKKTIQPLEIQILFQGNLSNVQFDLCSPLQAAVALKPNF